jgi:AraC family transcriptional regulator
MNVSAAPLSPESPVVFKRKAGWEGIRLEHCRLRAGELPEHCHHEHVALVSLRDGYGGELRTASGSRIHGTQRRGNVWVLPSGLAHTARLEGSSEHLALYLDPALVAKAATESHLNQNVQLVERFTSGDQVISSVGMALLGELETEGLSGRLYAESLANVLAVHLLRHYSVSPSMIPRVSGGLSGQRLRQVKDFIASNFADDIRLEDLAQQAHMSSFHFAREFKKSTGTTPHQYLIKFRVEQAKTLLENSELPLIEVGLRSGFSHQSHFTRLFHRFTGTTPQTYRRNVVSDL